MLYQMQIGLYFSEILIIKQSANITILILKNVVRSLYFKMKGWNITMLEYKFDVQLLVEGENLSEDIINDYIATNINGDCLLAVGDDELIKIHFHTNTPWKVLEYCASFGEISDIVVENMERQANGLKG